MKFGIRKPSLRKSISARTSIKRKIGIRMPKGMGVLRNPKKAIYNKMYNRTTISIPKLIKKLFK